MRLRRPFLSMIVLLAGVPGCLEWEAIGPSEPIGDIQLELVGGWLIGQEVLLDIVAEGDYVYVLSGYGVVILDVSDRKSPMIAGEWYGSSWTVSLAVEGDHLYVADSWNRLAVIDVSVPECPERVGQLSIDGQISDLFALDGKVYLAASKFFPSGYCSSVQVVDVSQPREPQLMGTSDFVGGHAWRICVHESNAYLTNSERRIDVFNVSDPGAPGRISSYSPQGGALSDISISGHRLHFICERAMEILDVSEPVSLENMVGHRYRLPYPAFSLFSQGHYVYVGTMDWIYAFDASDITNACVIDECEIGGFCDALFAKGDWLYCATQPAAVKIVKIEAR